MSRRRVLQLVSAGLSAALSVRVAHASPTFPDFIRENRGLSAVPACTVCHDTPGGGLGTATTPFAVYLQSRGLRGGDTSSLQTALAAAAAEAHDSNGDGTTDIEAIDAGQDPNLGADVPSPEFGCGAQVTRSKPSWLCSLVLAAVIVATFATRRRRAMHIT